MATLVSVGTSAPTFFSTSGSTHTAGTTVVNSPFSGAISPVANGHSSSASAYAPSTAHVTTKAAAATGKAPNRGLMGRGPTKPSAAYQKFVHGYIIEARWNTFQPVANGPIVTTAIDAAVRDVRAFNTANPTNPQGLRLRVSAGVYAPDWVKALSGPVAVKSPSGSTGTIPRWWTAPVQAAYAAFISKLAAYVDPIPEIREVTVGLTMLFFGEVMIRFRAQNGAAMAAAGYTEPLDIVAMKAMIDANKVFKSTITVIDVNMYQGTVKNEMAVTQQIIDYALANLHAVEITNASLSPTGNDTLYALMQSYGPKGSGTAAVSFQSMPTLTGLTTVLQRAVNFGASSTEMPNNPPPTTVSPFDAPLQANLRAMPWPWR